MNICVEMLFSRKIESVESLLDFVSRFLIENRVDAASQFALTLAIEEIFTNLVKHEPDAAAEIPLRIAVDDDKIVATLINRGGSVFAPDVSMVVDVDTPLRERECGGLGLHIARSLVDDLRFEHCEGDGIIVIVKYLEGDRA